jgi:acetyl-CoA decarbonylase/synthase, CODH/ACS complex subunit delta
MTYSNPVEKPNGTIREVTLDGGGSNVVIGGENAMPFYLFDGATPNKPKIAMEVFDAAPQGWAPSLTEALAGVLDDPAAWAKSCVEDHGADIICVQLASTDPNGDDASPEAAAATVRAVVDAVNVPVVVYGSGNAEKDTDVLKKVAEAVTDRHLGLGPATEDNYKPITAAALGYGHNVIAETPIDVNMAKQLNILITQMGLDAERIIIDPSCGAAGYGIEYGYTVMERLRLAALVQNDAMTQMPLIVNLGKEVWRAKEAKASEEEEPAWGDADKRGVLWEATTAITLAMSGADILIMRHPEAVRLVKTAIDGLSAQ